MRLPRTAIATCLAAFLLEGTGMSEPLEPAAAASPSAATLALCGLAQPSLAEPLLAKQGRASGKRKKKGGGKGKKRGGGKKKPKKSGSSKRSLGGKSVQSGLSLPGLGGGRGLDVPYSPPLTLDDVSSASGEEGEDGSDTRVSIELADSTQIDEWFALADYDGAAWISFREARASMGFERARYAYYDADLDGRLRLDEFERYYSDSMRLGGAFVPPKGPPGPTRPPARSPEQLRNAYDNDLDGAISLFELGRMLVDYGRVELEAGEVLRLIDSDRDEVVSVGELLALTGILHPVVVPLAADGEGDAPPDELGPQTILELFGAIELRGTEVGGTPYPPRIAGPVPTFRRLDLDGDGFISTIDLSELLRPLHLAFRPHAVLGTLDVDGDGRVSPTEFERAMVGETVRD